MGPEHGFLFNLPVGLMIEVCIAQLDWMVVFNKAAFHCNNRMEGWVLEPEIMLCRVFHLVHSREDLVG